MTALLLSAFLYTGSLPPSAPRPMPAIPQAQVLLLKKRTRRPKAKKRRR